MRIELNSGGLSSGVAIADFRSDFDSLLGKARKTVSSFQTIRSFTYNMNGGVGVLQDAVSQIESRLAVEEEKVTALEQVQKKADAFIEYVKQTDLKVGGLVSRNKQEFYELNPWAKPPPPPKEEQKEWYEHVGDFFNGLGNAVSETVQKAWNGIKSFCNSSVGKIVLSVGAVAALAALTVFTGGAAAVIFGMTAIGAGVGAVTGVGKGIYEYYEAKNKGKEVSLLDSIANNMAENTVKGAASGLADGIGLIGGVPARIVAGEVLQVGANGLTNMWTKGMSAGEAWKDAFVSGTAENFMDSLTFGIFSSSDIAKNAVTLPKNQILQYSLEDMKKDAYEIWSRELVKKSWREVFKPEINFKSVKGIINTIQSTRDTTEYKIFRSILTGHDSIEDYLSDGIKDAIFAH